VATAWRGSDRHIQKRFVHACAPQFRDPQVAHTGRHAGESLQLARSRLLIEPLWIAFFADCQRRINEDLHELGAALQGNRPRPGAVGSVGRDERSNNDGAGIGHELGHLGDAANILGAILWRETEVRVQAVPQIVAIENVGVHRDRK
jgi:hypothetical protein